MKKIGLEAKVHAFVLEYGLWADDKGAIDKWLKSEYKDLQYGLEMRTKVIQSFCLFGFLNV